MTGPGPAAQRFVRELDQLPPPELRGPEMLAVRLSQACVAALPVDGAGLSIHDMHGLRTPIGASDPVASQAERLQFTHGAGPCLRAHDDGVAIAFDEALIARNWPDLHDALIGDTPFRAVLSVPLLPPLGPLIVLDLYVCDPADLLRLDRDEVEGIALSLTGRLARELAMTEDGDPAGWWTAPDARRRTAVWQAMGMVSVIRDLDTGDALEVLKAHAFATGRVADDVAADIVAGRLDPRALGGAPDGR